LASPGNLDLFEQGRALETLHLPLPHFPRTRFQGSKRKLLSELAAVLDKSISGKALDLFSGSGSVTLLLRQLGHAVVANDYLKFANNTAWVFLNSNQKLLAVVDWKAILMDLLTRDPVGGENLVQKNFGGIYFTEEENQQIDRFAQNAQRLPRFEKAVVTYAVGQALLMKRPYNLFHRANLSMRQTNVKRSFGNAATWERPIIDHAYGAIMELTMFPFNETNAIHTVQNVNTSSLSCLSDDEVSLVYLDPPYVAANGKAIDYADFYHFLEGLVTYSLFDSGNASFAHRPIVQQSTRWSSPETACIELAEIARTWPKALLVMSYRDDGSPSADAITEILRRSGREVSVAKLQPYQYALSTVRASSELMLIARPCA
jgi:adenine-specific DNA-methyltransferase